jgi:hypothetical protein
MPTLEELAKKAGVQPLASTTPKVSIEELAKKAGVSPINAQATTPSQITQQTQPKKDILSKASNLTEKVLGAPSRFLFGTAGKTVGSLFTGALGAGGELMGKKTILGADVNKLQKEAGKNITPLNIGGTLLESTIAGVGEKTIAKIAGKLSAPLMARAEKLYQSAIKPSADTLKKFPNLLKTGLKEGIKVSKKGLQKTQSIIEDIGAEIGNTIEQGIAAGKVVEKNKLLPYLSEMKEYLGNSLGGKELIQEVDKISNKIIKELPDLIPVEQAQKIKVATGNLISKYYSKLAPMEIEVKKQLTRGLKEEIANVVPEIRTLNARDRELIGLEKALGATLKRMGNREVINAFDILSSGVGAIAAPGSPVTAAGGVFFLKKLLQSSSVKSGTAILLNNLSNSTTKLIKQGRYPAAIVASKILNLFSEQKD